MGKFEEIYNEALVTVGNQNQMNATQKPNQTSTQAAPQNTTAAKPANSANMFTKKLTPQEIDAIKKHIQANITKITNADQLLTLLFGDDQQQTTNQNSTAQTQNSNNQQTNKVQ